MLCCLIRLKNKKSHYSIFLNMVQESLKPYDPIDSLIEFETLTNYLIVVKYFTNKYLWFVNFFDRVQLLTK